MASKRAAGSRRRRLGVAGAVGAAGIGAAVGLRRLAVGRVRLRPDPDAAEEFGLRRGTPVPVLAPDGLPLHVEAEGPDDAPLTIVFCHGYCLNLHTWHYQRRDLPRQLGDGVRFVYWDQRSHGRSGRADPLSATIDQTGEDLAAVLAATVPSSGSRVLLVGHSMGTMTIMALAAAHPAMFAELVAGVVLVNTSAGDLKEMTLGLPLVLAKLLRPITPGTLRGLGRRADLVDRVRGAGADLAFFVTRKMAFADRYVSPSVVDFVEQMIRNTPIDVIAEFYPTLMDHDKTAALPVVAGRPAVVLVAGADRFTPAAHGRAVAAALDAELIEIEEAGHVLPLEYPGAVTGAVRRLAERLLAEPKERSA
ncbi:alpha/beta fold hydrolase [Actinomadura rayongensis]|uniref:Alpha/beta fold hydrolase n=1 Tax=Actinomadura rayongensis TaxID=1429076 RepID=A0A6I4VZL4_9ACTN|nr:alpha/beta hydrolase [Actinomadura rayongensis]MXQ62683.1 alpha/beta fold hydrolase [Actinomadura rayongensis]